MGNLFLDDFKYVFLYGDDSAWDDFLEKLITPILAILRAAKAIQCVFDRSQTWKQCMGEEDAEQFIREITPLIYLQY